MGRRSWIHFIGSQEQAEYLIKYIDKEDLIFIVGAAIIDGQIFTYDGRVFGIKDQDSLVLLTQSDGNMIIEEMVKNKLTDYFHTVLLDELVEEEIEYLGKGVKIKKVEYITEELFNERLKKLPDFCGDDLGLTIGNLKNFLKQFKNDKSVSVFLNLFDDNYPDKEFGIVYEIENWGNNNGHLDLWISDSLDRLEDSIHSTKKRHRKNNKN
ncbi:MAG: hypothetical protein ACTSRI_00850 [Promethearchaeota archaeon]